MSSKKMLFGVVLIVFLTSLLSAQVNFQHFCVLKKPISAANFEVTQLFDYDNDGYDDIVTQYFDEKQYIQNIIITDLSGTIIDSILIDDWGIYKKHYLNDKVTLIKQNDDNLLLRAQTAYPHTKLRFSVQCCETLSYIDSINVNPQCYSIFDQINTISEIVCNDQKIYCVGANECTYCQPTESEKSLLYFFQTKNDTLQFCSSIRNCGLALITQDNTVFTIGKYFQSLTGAWPGSDDRFYLNRIYFDPNIIYEQLNSVNGTVEWTDTMAVYNNYPKNYDIITKNSQDSLPHILQFRKLDTDNGTSVYFKGYDTTNWQNIWSTNDTEIGKSYITASTCIKVNDEDHYVMYFRGNKLEIRDRLDGMIIHHQDSVFAVCDILRKSDGELLFFVGRDDDMGLDVYTLDGPIFVSVDKPQEQNGILVEQYPNPFSDNITIKFSNREHTDISEIRIYNIKGQLIREFHPVSSLPSQSIEVTWDTKNTFGKKVANGIYFYTISTGNKILATQKCILIR